MPGGHRVEFMAAPPAGLAGATAVGRTSRRSARRGRGYDAPVRYPVESFTAEERALLAPHFTNLDRPVFALVNLPETVKGALFARYSRYSGTVRRLFLDEFAADIPAGGRPFDGDEGKRAADLYERIFIGYGDDSIAQVGGAHLACEWVSNVLTKVLQRGRLAAYLEQSTRYIPYDQPCPAAATATTATRSSAPSSRAAMDELFAIYSRSLGRVEAWAAERWPRGEEPEGAWQRSIRAKALDLLRGLLPAATLSHVGIFASGQAYEQLLLRLLASPLPEARDYGGDDPRRAEAGDAELRLAGRAARPRRRVGLLPASAAARRRRAGRAAGPRPRGAGDDAPSVDLVHVDGDRAGPARRLPLRVGRRPETEIRDRIDALDRDERAELLAALVGERAQPPPPARPRLRGGSLPLRDRLRLRRASATCSGTAC